MSALVWLIYIKKSTKWHHKFFFRGLVILPNFVVSCHIVLLSLYRLLYVSLGLEEVLARHRRSKDDQRDCQPLTDENLDIEVIRAGRDANGDSASHARNSVLKVSCGAGFKLNLQKRKIRCKRGEWRPALPQCLPIGQVSH